MDIKGEYKIAAPREKVFAALNDQDVLKACIPGCESLEKLSDTEMTAKVRLRIGPIMHLALRQPGVWPTHSGCGRGRPPSSARGAA